MRLFIGFDVSQEVRTYLAGLQQQVATLPAHQSMAKDFHCTLKFLGEVTPDVAQEAHVRLSKIRFKPFIASLAGIGVFPSLEYVRVVWVGLEPQEPIIALQQQVDSALHGLFPKDARFVPHITLSRVKAVRNTEAFKEGLAQVTPKPIRFTVSSFGLVRSVLHGAQGPLYEHHAVYTARE